MTTTRMSEAWVDRAMERSIRQRHEQVLGVQYFADEFVLVPGVTRTEEEVRKAAEKMYGPAQDPLLRERRRR